jgi:hypothetical protein
MFRIASRCLLVLAVLVQVGTTAVAEDQTDAWKRSHRLTPRDHKRMRAMGLKDQEVFYVANLSYVLGRDQDDIVQMIFRGQTAQMIADEYNLRGPLLTQMEPQWSTPEWQEAVKRGDASWPPLPMPRSMAPPQR